MYVHSISNVRAGYSHLYIAFFPLICLANKVDARETHVVDFLN